MLSLDVVLVFDRHTLGLRGGQQWSTERIEGSPYHVVDFVHADQTRRKLEHVVAQRDDNKLGVLGALLDVARDNRYLSTLVLRSHEILLTQQTYVSEIQRSINLIHDVQGCRLVVM